MQHGAQYARNSQGQSPRNQPATPSAVYPLVNPQTPGVQGQATPRDSISVRYQENSAIRVRGSVTGIYYEFSASRAIQSVDARDATSLLNTRFFRRA
jgi:hypothetical protein